MPDSLVLTRRFTLQAEAEIARAHLEEAGIDAVLWKDDAGGMYPFLQAQEGIRLMVPREQAAAAEEVLQNLVDVTAMEETTPGRIGVDLGGSKIEGVVLDFEGREVMRERIPTPRDDYEGTVEAVAALVERLESETGYHATVGIGTPGAVSPANGLIKNANSVWLNGKPLVLDLEERLGRGIRLANDADCFALSEAVDGAARGKRMVFGGIVGTGVGGGIVLDGKAWGGANAIAGEWGHNPLPWPREDELPGPPCYCGKRGCIETFLSGPGMIHDHLERTGQRRTPQEIVNAAVEEGNEAAADTLARYVDRMSRALAGVINVLDPDAVVLGGGMSNITVLYQAVPQNWGKYVFSDQVDTLLLRPVHGDSGGVRGAAWLWPRQDADARG